ncbi:hypothetical protein C5167_004828 [Papaver somniferum]|uniref:valine--tRNA ligase n=1 Tax=Papaver somniferum TaxID=3469 RepID=A0A4Y7J8Q2_PAPSO|nr:hypothetical protein C5167_004828 [Papaver somniferum]
MFYPKALAMEMNLQGSRLLIMLKPKYVPERISTQITDMQEEPQVEEAEEEEFKKQKGVRESSGLKPESEKKHANTDAGRQSGAMLTLQLIPLPAPSNMTGALTAAIQDTIVRWRRESGYNCCWVPGMRHAGIAAQAGLGEIVVATTRIETHLHGKYAIYPFNEREMPIVFDGILVDPQFWTGAVKITPAHDPNDFNVRKRHNLKHVNTLTNGGLINNNGGPTFEGMPRFKARVAVAMALKQNSLYRGAQDNQMPLWTKTVRKLRLSTKYFTLEEDPSKEFGEYADRWVVGRDEDEALFEANMPDNNSNFRAFYPTSVLETGDAWLCLEYNSVVMHLSKSNKWGNLGNLHRRLEKGNLDPNVRLPQVAGNCAKKDSKMVSEKPAFVVCRPVASKDVIFLKDGEEMSLEGVNSRYQLLLLYHLLSTSLHLQQAQGSRNAGAEHEKLIKGKDAIQKQRHKLYKQISFYAYKNVRDEVPEENEKKLDKQDKLLRELEREMTLLRCTISMSYCYLLMDMGLLLFGSSMMKLSSVFSFVKLGKRSGRLHYGDTYK